MVSLVETPPIDCDAEIWDARAEFHVGTFILRYLSDWPAADGSRYVDDLEKWGTNLAKDGRERLKELDASPLRSIGGDA